MASMSTEQDPAPEESGPLLISQEEWNRKFPSGNDKIFVRNLSVNALVEYDAWGRQKPQPVLISFTISLRHSFGSAAESDGLDQSTVNYGTLSKAVIAEVEKNAKTFMTVLQLACLVEEACEGVTSPEVVEAIEVEIFLPKAVLLGGGVGFRYCHQFGRKDGLVSKVLFLKDLRIPTLIGLNKHEREVKQLVVVNVWIDSLKTPKDTTFIYGLQHLTVKTVEVTSFKTVESLAAWVAAILIKYFARAWSEVSDVKIRVEKPSAVTSAEATGAEIVRSLREGHYPRFLPLLLDSRDLSTALKPGVHGVLEHINDTILDSDEDRAARHHIEGN